MDAHSNQTLIGQSAKVPGSAVPPMPFHHPLLFEKGGQELQDRKNSNKSPNRTELHSRGQQDQEGYKTASQRRTSEQSEQSAVVSVTRRDIAEKDKMMNRSQILPDSQSGQQTGRSGMNSLQLVTSQRGPQMNMHGTGTSELERVTLHDRPFSRSTLFKEGGDSPSNPNGPTTQMIVPVRETMSTGTGFT